MDFDTTSFLENLFGGTPEAAAPEAPDVAAAGPQTGHAAGDGPGAAGGREAGGGATVPTTSVISTPTTSVIPAAGPELEWIEPDEDIPFRTCPTCGGFLLWETIAGTWRCQHCDATAWQRSRSLLEKAARLRERSLRLRLADEARPGRCVGPAADSTLPAAS